MHLENQLIQAFTSKASLEQSAAEQWASLLEQYPAFTLAHYLSAKKLGSTQNEAAHKQRQQAALRFNDIRWLDYLLKTDFSGQTERENPVKKDWEKSIETPESVAGKQQTPAAQHGEPGAQSLPTVLPDGGEHARLSAILSAQLVDFKKPVEENARLEVDREPLYKVDYFASQGISILKTQDGLDKKVRKFTDWLKEMKQQGSGPATPQLNTTPQEEALAAQSAEKSLKNEPVWTESMAEVLAEQGKTAQAVEIYQKLSLLYPEKSTYFASKIDLLQ